MNKKMLVGIPILLFSLVGCANNQALLEQQASIKKQQEVDMMVTNRLNKSAEKIQQTLNLLVLLEQGKRNTYVPNNKQMNVNSLATYKQSYAPELDSKIKLEWKNASVEDLLSNISKTIGFKEFKVVNKKGVDLKVSISTDEDSVKNILSTVADKIQNDADIVVIGKSIELHYK